MACAKNGRMWRIGTADDVDWIAGHTTSDHTVTTAIPPVFDAYATCYAWDGVVEITRHEHAVLDVLVAYTRPQPWWLAYLDTGAHDIVFPTAPKVSLYWQWPYVLVQAGPEQARTWRTGHMRGPGCLPDLFFPVDRSWLVSGLWDDLWTCVGGPVPLIDALVRNPHTNARRVAPGEDALPPGLTRD